MNAPNELGETSIRALFFKYYLPALTRILSITIHQVINGVILGRQVGKEGLALPGYWGLNGIWLSRSLAEIATLVVIGLYTLVRKERFYTTKVIVR